MPPPPRNPMDRRTVIYLVHELEDIFPSEQIKHDGNAGEN
jgi:hypothetical protein